MSTTPKRALARAAGVPDAARWLRKPAGLGISAICCVLATPFAVRAQSSAPGYTDIQATIGAEIYVTVCALCHQPDLKGTAAAPELAGPGFRDAWGDRPVVELLGLVQATMPPHAAGSLTPDEAAALVAYILRANEVEPGTSDLSLDSSGTVIPSRGSPTQGK